MKTLCLILGSILVLTISTANAADLQKGVDAINRSDFATALAEIRPLAEQGNANAQYFLWLMNDNGEGIPQDYGQAAEWYRKAAGQGHLMAQLALASMYATGQGIPKDYVQAAAWNRKAAEQGEIAAQFKLGIAYENGWGVPQDYAQAAVWYRKAAEQGNPAAQSRLGTLYKNGKGVPQDYSQAMAWYRKAAAQGDSTAQTLLGLMYDIEGGGQLDLVKAYALYNLAAALDTSSDSASSKMRSSIMSIMTPAQIEAGQTLTREMQRAGVLKALDSHVTVPVTMSREPRPNARQQLAAPQRTQQTYTRSRPLVPSERDITSLGSSVQEITSLGSLVDGPIGSGSGTGVAGVAGDAGDAGDAYCDGYKHGFKEGVCHEQFGCLPPFPPMCPMPKFGEGRYLDGYNRGFLDGLHEH